MRTRVGQVLAMEEARPPRTRPRLFLIVGRADYGWNCLRLEDGCRTWLSDVDTGDVAPGNAHLSRFRRVVEIW